MAVVKRGKTYHIYIRPFEGKQVTVKTQAKSKAEARQLEMAVMTACRASDYRGLDPSSRELCVRMFRNQGWEIPHDLFTEEGAKQELTLWRASELFLKYPEVRGSLKRERYMNCLVHLVGYWGKDFPVKSLWVPEIKEYQLERLSEGAAPATVNREKSTLSKVFQVLIELRHVDTNPARLVRNLSEKSGERQAYLSKQDFETLCAGLPPWLRPIVQVAYFTGMRQGEILSLRRGQVKLSRRLIVLGPEDVKEGQWKRIPIHRDLIPIIESAMKVQAIDDDHVFLVEGHLISRFSIKKPWNRAARMAGLHPCPRFHDLRHAWKTNARRSGIDPEIRESILGHWFKERSVSERYGRISDAELVTAIDLMTFDHGPTEILVANAKKEKPGRSSNFSQAEKMLAGC
jgi:integrase